MPTAKHRSFVRRVAGLLLGVATLVLVGLSLRGPIALWLRGAEMFDEEAIREWIREARVESANLPELAKNYLDMIDREARLKSDADKAAGVEQFSALNELRAHQQRLDIKREEIQEFLKALGNPPTRLYRGQLPLFPLIYRLSVTFDARTNLAPIFWDSNLPRESSQYRELKDEQIHPQAQVSVKYHLHAYHQVQAKERQEATRRLLLGGLVLLALIAGSLAFVLFQRRQRREEHHRLLAEQQASEADRRRLEEELRRQEAERKHEEAERINLELKSQLFANIGIMAGSYAHNIKNLLVRPNDLLRRCLEEQPTGDSQNQMLKEVKDTLATVTERLQQILQTVRRDPSKAVTTRIDLNQLVGEMHRTWNDLAREKWKMNLKLDLTTGPLVIEGDLSHLQQALENLLFNARDATFEMRNRLRDAARQGSHSESDKRQALLAAAAWRGEVTLRTRCEREQFLLEVIDNGIGMTEEIRKNCTQTHFSTKRNNALFAGLSAGMGLGLSFVSVILGHHQATMEIESEPEKGALFRVRFPATKL